MTIATIIILCVLAFLLGPRIFILILAICGVSWLLCDIDIEDEYYWYSGIWHGLFFIPNFIRSLIFDTPYKADLCTTGYSIWYWIFSILTTLKCLFGMLEAFSRR